MRRSSVQNSQPSARLALREPRPLATDSATTPSSDAAMTAHHHAGRISTAIIAPAITSTYQTN